MWPKWLEFQTFKIDFMALSFFERIKVEEPLKGLTQALDITSAQEASKVQNSSKRKGRGRERSEGAVFNRMGLWYELCADRWWTAKCGNKWTQWELAISRSRRSLIRWWFWRLLDYVKGLPTNPKSTIPKESKKLRKGSMDEQANRVPPYFSDWDKIKL